MIQNVERFNAELRVDSLREVEILHDGRVPRLNSSAAEHITDRVAASADGRGRQNRIALYVAAVFLQRNIAQAARSSRLVYASGYADRGGTGVVRRRIPIQAAEIVGITGKIPGIVELLRSRRIVRAAAAAAETPGKTGLKSNDRRQLPAVHQAGIALLSGKSVSDSPGEAMPNVEIAIGIVMTVIEGCIRRARPFAGG